MNIQDMTGPELYAMAGVLYESAQRADDSGHRGTAAVLREKALIHATLAAAAASALGVIDRPTSGARRDWRKVILP